MNVHYTPFSDFDRRGDRHHRASARRNRYGFGELMENGVELALLFGNRSQFLMTTLPGLHVFKSIIAGLLVVFLAVCYLTVLASRILARLQAPLIQTQPTTSLEGS